MRYGIIGSGMMGIEHMLNLRLLDDAVIAAVADPHETSRKWARDTAGPDAALFADAREMLDRCELDAVVVSTPNHTHADVLDAIWGRELHVMVEKPLCTTLPDCWRVEREAARHPGLVWVAMEYRYMPPVARLIREVRDGTAGRLRMLAIREHRFPFLPKVGDWNRFNRNTGGTLVEKCCHFFDLMNLIVADRPLRVYASGAQDVNHLDESYDGEVPDILDNAFAVVDYADGARALLDLCMFAEGARNHNELVATGDAGQVRCAVPDCVLEILPRRREDARTLHVPVEERLLRAGFHHGSTYYEHAAFRDAVRTGGAPEVDVRDGSLAVAMGIAAQRSIEERRPVELAELDG